MSSAVEVDALGFEPEWSANLLIFVEREGDAENTAGRALDGAAELHHGGHSGRG